jgi:hypothetical protein
MKQWLGDIKLRYNLQTDNATVNERLDSILFLFFVLHTKRQKKFSRNKT